MAIIAKKGKDLIPVPAGTHLAICVQVVHIGTYETEYKGKKRKDNKARFLFELPNETKVFDEAKGEHPFVISKEFTISVGKKSTLRPILEAWLGRTLTAQEEKNGFDITTLIGLPAIVSVIHEENEGTTYSRLQTVTGLAKGMTAPAASNPLIVFDYYDENGELRFNPNFYKLPEYLQEKIKQTDEWKDLEAQGLITENTEEEEDADADHLAALDRASLKAYIAQKGYAIKVVKSMEDEDIRNAIRTIEAKAKATAEEEEEE